MSSAASPLQRAAQAIPPRYKPVLAVLLNLGLSTLLGYLASPWVSNDLRSMKNLPNYTSLVSLRVLEVLGYWIGGWDATQAASLSILSIAPGLHFFHTYHPSYAPLWPTLTVSTAIDAIAVYLPIRFLRPEPAIKRSRVTDFTRVTAALLTSFIYQLTLQVAAKKFLTAWLLGAGWELESVESVHNVTEAQMLTRALMMLPIGWAATEVILTADGQAKKPRAEGIEEDAKGLMACLVKMWLKLSPKTRKVIKRTAVVAAYQAAGATGGVAATAKGGDWVGAAGLSGVWVAATTIVGLVLGWVGEI